MRVTAVNVRDFRSYERAAAPLGKSLTVVHGPNGAGKSNLLEAVYFGCTGRSCRTSNEREVVRFAAATTRVVISSEDDYGSHELTVGLTPGEAKRMTVDGAAVERLLDVSQRPLVSVFLPDRLELIKGVPALRRAHLDQLVTGLWPSRSANRRSYSQALAQRNALLSRIRVGAGSRASLETWDAQLAAHALALMHDRAAAIDAVSAAFARICELLNLDGELKLAYRPRSRASEPQALVDELRERVDSDLERGFTGHGPHRDDFSITRNGRELRTYGSQGQQRLSLLSLLLAEREIIGKTRDATPLMLLDDVMSEIDAGRRRALVEMLEGSPGQALITTTDIDHVPGADAPGVTRIEVGAGSELQVEHNSEVSS
jgi:DNA replication and repair protein RecF